MRARLARWGLVAVIAAATAPWLAGCASGPPAAAPLAVEAAILAPTGSLRVGVYPGSPTSLVRDAKTGQSAGVAYELGQAMAVRLGVPVRVVEYQRVAQVVAAVKAGELDMTFTNATAARERDVDFTVPLVRLELGFLVPARSTLASIADIDKPGMRVGVTEGSSSSSSLPRLLKSASILTAPSMDAVQAMLRDGRLDAFATNKGILFELSDALPGSRVLAGRWGLEGLAIAVPKGRQLAQPWLQQFVTDVQSGGQLKAIVARAGLRGSAAE